MPENGFPLSRTAVRENFRRSCGKAKTTSFQRKLESSDLKICKGTGFQLSLE
jgi:hypothetical protein